MEVIEWITVPQMSTEFENSHVELCIEVRVFAQWGDLCAEPIYYKLVGRDGKILMDGAYASREADRMWRYIEHVVAGEYTFGHLDWMALEHPAFAALRDDAQVERRLDLEWYRASVL